MPDPIVVVAVPAVAVPVPVVPPVRSGLQTTELWVSMLLLGALGTVGEQLVQLIPVLLSNPALPPWVVMAVPAAILGLGWVMKLVHAEYVRSRVALKLPVPPVIDVTAAVAAGAAAANAGQVATLAAGNS